MFGNLASSSQWFKVINAETYNLDQILKYSLSNPNPIYETNNNIEKGGETNEGSEIHRVVKSDLELSNLRYRTSIQFWNIHWATQIRSIELITLLRVEN